MTPDMEKNEKWIASINMVGRSDALAEIARKVHVYRQHTRNVLVLGESGTGKELVAKALSTQGVFRAVNCASYRANPTLLESALFGHMKGAFTGAGRDRKGVFEEANGGTVFLDEIPHLSADVQVSILRAIQEKKVTRIGSALEHPVSFRLVAAAKPDLEALVDRGEFRLDLYYRIRGATLLIPPLRERAEDIEPLVHYFTNKWMADNQRQKCLSPRTIRHLERYGWPGNVRELENTVYDLLDLSPSSEIQPQELDPIRFPPLPQAAAGSLCLRTKVFQVEREHITMVLKSSRSVREAARRMAISPQKLLRLLKKHGMTSLKE